MSDMSGEVCFLEGLTLASLIGKGSPTAPTLPLSINQLFNYSSDSQRMGGQTLECRYRPQGSTATFRPSTDGALHAGEPTTIVPAYASESAVTEQPIFFGLAWRGLDVIVGHPLVIDLIKNVEFRLTPLVNMAHSPPEQLTSAPVLDRALKVLDTSAPAWQTAHAQALAPTLAQIALGGLPNAVEDLAKSGLGYLAGLGGQAVYSALGAV